MKKAIIETNKGTIVLELFEKDAPKTVANFEKLIKQGFYPGYSIKCEINPKRHTKGALSMAHAGKNTGGSQFFITHSPQPHLDGVHTVFGKVIEGMDVVNAIKQSDIMTKLTVEED